MTFETFMSNAYTTNRSIALRFTSLLASENDEMLQRLLTWSRFKLGAIHLIVCPDALYHA